MSSIHYIMTKLSNAGVDILFENLPSDRNDTIWKDDIKPKLSLNEFSALKNARCPSATTSSTQFNNYYLNIYKI